MNVEKVINESVKQNETTLDLSRFKTITEADLNLVLYKIETHFVQIKLNPLTRLNPKCKSILSKIEAKLMQKQQPTETIYNLLAHHTYYFNFKHIISDDYESIGNDRVLFQCCSPLNTNNVSPTNNKIEILKNEFHLSKQLIQDEWKVDEIFNEHGYLSIMYINNKTKQLVLAFQGIRLFENDFQNIDNVETFVEKLLAKKCIHMTYAYVHAKKSVRIANKKNYYLSFTGYSFGAWLAETCASLFETTLKNKYSKNVTFKANGSIDQCEKFISTMNKKLDQTSETDLFQNWDLMDYLLAPYRTNNSKVDNKKI
jgi:hypothetical protein